MAKLTRAERARFVKTAIRYDMMQLGAEIDSALVNLHGVAAPHPPPLVEVEKCLQRAFTILKRLDVLSHSSSG